MAVASQKMTETKFLDLIRGALTAAPTTVLWHDGTGRFSKLDGMEDGGC